MKAVPMGKVWGGSRMYSNKHLPGLLKAFNDFTESPVDPKAAIILTIEKMGGNIAPVLFLFYDGPEAPEGVFKQFEDIPISLTQLKR
jgi:hypothetical protein